MQRHDDLHWQFLKNSYISIFSVAKLKNIVFFIFTYVSESQGKQGDKAVTASSLQFFRSVRRFIATIFYSALNASLQLLFKEESSFKASMLLLFKEIHRLKVVSGEN
jgi:hypothetical protein